MTLMTLDEFSDILLAHLPVWESMRLLPPATVLPFLEKMFEADIRTHAMSDVRHLAERVLPVMERYLFGYRTTEEIAACANQFATQWHFRPYYWLVFFMYYNQLNEMPELVQCEGVEILQAQLLKKKGALVIPPHLGISLVPPLLLSATGHRTHTVTNKEEVPFVRQLIDSFGAPSQLVPVADQMSLVSALKRLQQNEVVLMYPEVTASDRQPRYTVEFLGRRVQAPEGPAALAGAAGVPMLPAALVRTDGRFRFVFGEPIAVDGTEPASIAAALQRLWHWIEGWVLHYPDQWWLWPQFERSILAPTQARD